MSSVAVPRGSARLLLAALAAAAWLTTPAAQIRFTYSTGQTVSPAYEGWMPAFVVRTLEDVVKHNIIRTRKLGQPLTTEDFLRAANAKRAERDAHQLATDRPPKPALEAAVENVFERVLQHHVVDLSDGEIMVRS